MEEWERAGSQEWSLKTHAAGALHVENSSMLTGGVLTISSSQAGKDGGEGNRGLFPGAKRARKVSTVASTALRVNVVGNLGNF